MALYCGMTGWFVFVLLYYHVLLVTSAQTTYEYLKQNNPTLFTQGWFQNWVKMLSRPKMFHMHWLVWYKSRYPVLYSKQKHRFSR